MKKSLYNLFHPLHKILRKRSAYVTETLPLVIRELVHTPSPERTTLARSMDYIVLDFETTGLNAEKDIILSIGWVEIVQGKVDLARSSHFYINTESQVNPETAVINHITPQMLSTGIPIDDAMMLFMEQARGKIIVAHGCIVEISFFGHYLHDRFGILELPLLWIDTLKLEKSMARNLNMSQEISLTLAETRMRYGLPEYNAHNALADAVATAELFLVQTKRLSPDSTIPFSALYRLSES